MPENIRHDVIIIGGGVAGSAAAILLGREGRKVLLLEKEVLAHHKVCGEFISFEAEHYLTSLGLDLTALGAERISHIRLIKGKRSIVSALPFSAASLSRFKLDEALLYKASSEACDVRRGVTVNKLNHDTAGWRMETSSSEFAADAVFLATGKHDLRGWDRANGKQNDMIGFKMHFQLREDKKAALSKHVEIILFNGGYAGLEPIEDGVANFCLVVKKSQYAACGKNWKEFIGKLLLETPYLADQLEGAKACWEKPLAVYGIPYGFIYHSNLDDPPNLYRIGDQMAVIPSFCGEGMAIALHTAHKACFSYLGNSTRTHHLQVQRELSPQIWRASMLSQLSSFRFVQHGMISVCGVFPKLLQTLASETRLKIAAKGSLGVLIKG